MTAKLTPTSSTPVTTTPTNTNNSVSDGNIATDDDFIGSILLRNNEILKVMKNNILDTKPYDENLRLMEEFRENTIKIVVAMSEMSGPTQLMPPIPVQLCSICPVKQNPSLLQQQQLLSSFLQQQALLNPYMQHSQLQQQLAGIVNPLTSGGSLGNNNLSNTLNNSLNANIGDALGRAFANSVGGGNLGGPLTPTSMSGTNMNPLNSSGLSGSSISSGMQIGNNLHGNILSGGNSNVLGTPGLSSNSSSVIPSLLQSALIANNDMTSQQQAIKNIISQQNAGNSNTNSGTNIEGNSDVSSGGLGAMFPNGLNLQVSNQLLNSLNPSMMHGMGGVNPLNPSIVNFSGFGMNNLGGLNGGNLTGMGGVNLNPNNPLSVNSGSMQVPSTQTTNSSSSGQNSSKSKGNESNIQSTQSKKANNNQSGRGNQGNNSGNTWKSSQSTPNSLGNPSFHNQSYQNYSFQNIMGMGKQQTSSTASSVNQQGSPSNVSTGGSGFGSTSSQKTREVRRSHFGV